MNDTGRQLVEAAEAELDGIEAEVFERLPKAVAAVLRKLADLMDDEETDEDWPDPDDLALLADDIEGGGE